MEKSQADFGCFSALDIRVGQIVSAEPANTNKPTYRITLDFGNTIGKRVSCGAYTNYKLEELTGKQVIAIINFAVKKMGPEISEVLILGVPDPQGLGTLFLTVDKNAKIGSAVF